MYSLGDWERYVRPSVSVALAYAIAVTFLAWALLAFQFVGLGLLTLRVVERPLSLATGFTAF